LSTGPDLITGCTSPKVVVLFWDLKDLDFIPSSLPGSTWAITY